MSFNPATWCQIVFLAFQSCQYKSPSFPHLSILQLGIRWFSLSFNPATLYQIPFFMFQPFISDGNPAFLRSTLRPLFKYFPCLSILQLYIILFSSSLNPATYFLGHHSHVCINISLAFQSCNVISLFSSSLNPATYFWGYHSDPCINIFLAFQSLVSNFQFCNSFFTSPLQPMYNYSPHLFPHFPEPCNSHPRPGCGYPSTTGA